MGLFADTYNVMKEVISIAKKAKNQVVVEKLIELQEIFFKLREENGIRLDKIKSLEYQLSEIKKNVVNEKLFRFYPKGFFINGADKPILPYCSRCWMVDKKTSSTFSVW